jgi:flagellar protein FliO/FliZ
MTESLLPVGIFLLVLALAPFALKWIKQRGSCDRGQGGVQAKFISALAVGPHQRVVTVEVGPEERRVWLTLGVTAQEISCLHCADVGSSLVDSKRLVDIPSGPSGPN